MNKKDKIKIEIDEKEEANIEKWLPVGLCLGTVIGAILSFIFGNILFLAGGTSFGLLLGIMIGSISSEENEESQDENK